jgi:hypothetical protein
MQPVTQYPNLPDAYPYPATIAEPYRSVQDQAPPPPTPPPAYVDNPYASPEKPGQPPLLSRRNLLIGGAAVVLAGGTGLYFFSRESSGPIPVPIVYSTEKGPWLNAVLTAFKQSSSSTLNNRTIDIQLIGLGSVAGQSQILNGQITPVAWSPASTLEMNRLNYKWQQARGTPIINTSQSLVNSPLVLLSWRQREQKLLAHYHVPTLDWPTLYSAFQANSWAALGGSQSWGRVKFAQTVPEQSNSGLLTITLLAYEHFNQPRTLSKNLFDASSSYWSYLDVFEQSIISYGCSSGTYLTKVLADGPAQADIIATYENLALTLPSGLSDQSFLISYPSPNILSDHPFAVLQGSWVTDEQSQAAQQFRDFLLTRQQQFQAVHYGFRPGPNTTGISLQDSTIPGGNPFLKHAALFPDHMPDPVQSLTKVPVGEVVDAMLNGWDAKYNNTYTVLDGPCPS